MDMRQGSDPLRSPKLRLERARHHLESLRGEMRNFFAAQPFDQRLDAQNGSTLLKVCIRGVLPSTFETICADTISNIRSALDQTVWALATANGGISSKPYFPVAANLAEYNANAPSKLRGVPQSAQSYISALEPYQHGKGQIFWAISRAENACKHRELIGVGLTHAGSRVTVMTQAGPQAFSANGPQWDDERGEVILIHNCSEPPLEVAPNFYLTFRHVEPVHKWIVDRTLNEAIGATHHFITECQSKFF